MSESLVPARFKSWMWFTPLPPAPVQSTRWMVGAPSNYEADKIYILPRAEFEGKQWWKVVRELPNGLVVAQFQPMEVYMKPFPAPAPIKIIIPKSPGNYEDGKIYDIPESDMVCPWWERV